MTDIVDIKGTEAVQKLLRRMRLPGALRKAIDGQCQGGNIQSCNYTAGAVFEILNENRRAINQEGSTIPEIQTLLGQPKIIYFWITPDHHFIVVPVGSGQLVLIQGFQDTYDLLDWLRSPGSGIRKVSDFINDLTDLLSITPATREAAAIRLFSIPGKDADIREYYSTRAVTIKTVNSAFLT